MNVCRTWACLEAFRVDFEWFYAFLRRSRWLLNRFWPPFDPFLIHFDPIWGHIGPFSDDFGVILDHFSVDPGSFWGHLGIILASFWHHFGVVFASFWTRFRAFYCVFDTFGRFLGPFLAKSGHFWVVWVIKMYWNPITQFWRGHLGLSIRKGTRSNGHEYLELWPVLGAKNAILHRD